MLRNASALKGYSITANDGSLGAVSDLLFDDASWTIRWLAVDTGKFMSGRKLLLPPGTVELLDHDARDLKVSLSVMQLRNSPEIDSDLPVSPHMEKELRDFYDSNSCRGFGDAQPRPATASQWRPEYPAESIEPGNLRSISAVMGYQIGTIDGEIGHVEDLLVQDKKWRVDYLVIDTQNWWSRKRVLVSPRSVQEIDWPEKTVELKMPRQAVRDSPLYEALVTIDPSYAGQYNGHYV